MQKILTKKRELHKYPLEKSPFYKLSNKKRLSELLGVDISDVRDVEKSGLCLKYRSFVDKKTRRFITEPIGDLGVVHKKILKFLTRIAPPDYIHSAIKKRSYKTNATAHCSGKFVIKVDIKKFFQSVKFERIHDFFLETLRCSPDVATILAKICTVRTDDFGSHLPTGSCISPILSFLANKDLFDEIDGLSKSEGCVFTLYVDDMTISGERANAELLSKVVTAIFKRGYLYHKTNISRKKHSLVTGLIVGSGKIYLPHDRALKIRQLREALDVSVGAKDQLLSSLVGRLSEAEQIDPRYRPIRLKVVESHKATWRRIILRRTKLSLKARNTKARLSKSG